MCRSAAKARRRSAAWVICSAPTGPQRPGLLSSTGRNGGHTGVLLGGEGHFEAAPARGAFRGPDGAMVGSHDSRGDGQAESAAAALAGPALVKPDEPLENAVPVSGRDRLAVVVHGQDGPVRRGMEGD